MSVINQMLKDLEQRTPESGQVPSALTANNKNTTVKITLVVLSIVVILNLIGLYIWSLQSQVEQSELTIKQQTRQLDVKKHNTADIAKSIESATNVPVEQSTQPLTLPSKKILPVVKASEKVDKTEPLPIPKSTIKKTLVRNPVNQPVQASQNEKTKVITAPVSIPPPSHMSISRRQLTSTELVEQKLQKADKAINLQQMTKAESLYEDVLIIDPNHKQARKKLAALWFGRHAYQPAINVLSQGIALDKTDAELRMLKAKIQGQQGQHQGAYNTLKKLSALEQQDYQVMLANAAQKVEAYDGAIKAYNILITMQPYSGRWHLGLAIIYDKTSEFALAEKEYAIALTKNDLSQASADFAAQRLQALGE